MLLINPKHKFFTAYILAFKFRNQIGHEEPNQKYRYVVMNECPF